MMKLIVLLVYLGQAYSRSAIHRAANEADYMPNADDQVEYDHEAFLGHDAKEEFDNLSSEDAKRKLYKMLPRLDEDGDQKITVDELYDWIKKQLLVYIMDDARQLHEGNDVNHDGFVSWKEYVATTYGLGFVDNEQKPPKDGQFDYRELILRDYNKFIAADTNGDQFLSVEEMGAFVHPEEFHHTKHLALQQSMNDLDRNKDGKISLQEYIADIMADEEDHTNQPEWLDSEKRSFLEHRDKNGDGKVDIAELRAWFQPDEKSPARIEAEHLVLISDIDKDGVLSFSEILKSYQVFVGSQVTDFGRMLHSEL